MSRNAACACLALAMIMTGANVPLGKTIVATLPVGVFALLRFTAASGVLALLARSEPGPRLATLTAADWRDIALMALLGMVAYTLFILEGVKRTSGTNAGILLATLPAVVALIGALVLRERLGPVQLLAVGLAVAGVALVQVGGGRAATNPAGAAPGSSLAGNLLVGAAVLGEAAFVLLSRRVSARLGPLQLALAASLCAALLSVPWALADVSMTDVSSAQGGILMQLSRVPASTWLLAAWYALSASVLCLWLWYAGIGHVETWMAGICTACLPLAALAVSVLVLGETVSPAQLAGAGLVIAATLAGSLSRPTKQQPAA